LFQELLEQYEPFLLAKSELEQERDDVDKLDEGEVEE
jgi:hypothetical protein